MNSFIKNTFVIFLSLLVTFFSSCEKMEENIREGYRHIDLTIDGKKYSSSSHAFPLLEPIYPISGYVFSEDSKCFSLATDCVPISTKEVSADNILKLDFSIFLEKELTIGEKYNVHTIPDLDYYMPYGTNEIYIKNKISYCQLNIMSSLKGYCFGNGFVELIAIDLENDELEGIFEFDIIFSKEKIDNPNIVKVKGEFKTDF